MSFDSESKVWYGPNDPYLYGNMSIGEAIFEFMSENPDHMMEIPDDDSEVFICERMKSVAARIAENLMLRGLQPGQPVILILKNHALDSPLLVACAFVGAVICILPHDLNIEKYRKVLSDVRPKMVLITEKSHAKQMLSASVVANVQSKFYILDNELGTCQDLRDLVDFKVQSGEEFLISKCGNPDKDVAMILVSCNNMNQFSNGNGIILVNLTHKMIMRGIKQDDLFSKTVVSTSNFSHPMEVIRALRGFMTPVTRIAITSNDFSAATILHSIRKNDVTQLVLDLTDVNSGRFVEYLQKTEFVVRGIDQVSLFGKEVDEKMIGIHTSFFGSKITFDYVIDELGGSVFHRLHDGSTSILGKLGFHLKGKIVEENGKTYSPHEVGVGELLVGCEFSTPRYLNSPLKNNKKFNEDGFFRTGLLGYFDTTGQFYLIESGKRSPNKSR